MKLVVNLLSPTYRRQLLLRRRSVQWGTALGAVLLTIWCGRWLELREYHALAEQLEAATREEQPTQMMLREVGEMRQQVEDLQLHEAVAQELEHHRSVLPVLGLVSRSAQLSDGKLRVTELQIEELQSLATHEPGQRDKADPGTVKLVGVALDSPTVAVFHESLVDAGMFVDVKLIKSNERKAADLALYDYELSCEL